VASAVQLRRKGAGQEVCGGERGGQDTEAEGTERTIER